MRADAVFYTVGNRAREAEGAGIYEDLSEHFDERARRLKVRGVVLAVFQLVLLSWRPQ